MQTIKQLEKARKDAVKKYQNAYARNASTEVKTRLSADVSRAVREHKEAIRLAMLNANVKDGAWGFTWAPDGKGRILVFIPKGDVR